MKKLNKRKFLMQYLYKFRNEWINLTYHDMRKRIFDETGVEVNNNDIMTICNCHGIYRGKALEKRRHWVSLTNYMGGSNGQAEHIE